MACPLLPGTLLDVSAGWAKVFGAEGEVHVHGSTVGVGDQLHRALDAIGADGLHHDSSIAGHLLLLFAVNLHFELAARGIHDGAGTISAVDVKSGVLFEFLFGDAFFLDAGAWLALHHGFYAGALLWRHLVENVGRNSWHGCHSGHGMSHGDFPEALLDVERSDFVGGPEGQRGKDDQGQK